MGQLLQINMDINIIDWRMLYDKFDSRSGFQMIIFGLSHDEDCELLIQVSTAIDFDMSFIKYPEGRAFDGGFNEEAASIEEFISFFKNLLKRLDERTDFYTQINYRYISIDYFRKKIFNRDIQVLIDFFEHHRTLGASKAWFEFI